MNRRSFLGFLGAGIAGVALDQAIPLGRVWSFPKTIVLPSRLNELATVYYDKRALDSLKHCMPFEYGSYIHPFTVADHAKAGIQLYSYVPVDQQNSLISSWRS